MNHRILNIPTTNEEFCQYIALSDIVLSFGAFCKNNECLSAFGVKDIVFKR